MRNKILREDGVTEITGIQSVTYSEAVNAGENLRPGCVASASIAVRVYGTDAPSQDEALSYYQVDDEDNETFIGVFYAEPSVPSNNMYSFVAYDAVSKLDKPFSERLNAIQSSFPMTLDALLDEVYDEADVEQSGKNLILNTFIPDVSAGANYPKLENASSNTVTSPGTVTVATHGIRNTSTDARRPTFRFGSSDASSATMQGLVAGETYNFSFDAAWKALSGTLGNTTTYYPQIILFTDTESTGSFAVTTRHNFGTIKAADRGTEMTGRCEFTFTIPNNVTIVYFGVYSSSYSTNSAYAAGDYLELSNIKLEKGSKATPYIPSFDDITIQSFYSDGLSCRNILQYAAEITGRFVRCDTSGNLVFDWYTTNTDYSVHPGASQQDYIAYKLGGLDYSASDVTPVTAVAVKQSNSEGLAYVYPSGASDQNTLIVSNNLLLTNASASLYNAVAENIYTILHDLPSYRYASIQLFRGENKFRSGEFVSVTDKNGVTFLAPVFSMTESPNGAALQSRGRDTYTSDEGTPVEKQIKNLSSNVVQLDKLKVDWAEIDTAIVNSLRANGINADWINAGRLKAEFLRLYGAMEIYKTETFTLANLGGRIGFTSGNAQSNIEQGIVQVSQNYYGVSIVGNNGVFIGFHTEFAPWIDGGDIKINDGNYDVSVQMDDSGLHLTGDYVDINGRYPLSEIGNLSSLSTTNKDSLVAAINEVDDSTPKIIWANSDPTQGMAAQTLTLDSDMSLFNYFWVEICWTQSTTTRRTGTWIYVPDGETAVACPSISASASSVLTYVYRYITIDRSNNEISVGNGQRANPTTVSGSNNFAIPTRIMACKI